MSKKKTDPSDVTRSTDDFESTAKQTVPKDEWGHVGVRATMTNAGLKNDKIGYDGEYVTYAGARLLKPTFESNGVSYANPSDIYNAIKRAYESEGDSIVPIAQKASSYGVPQYNAKYENGEVYLGGIEVPSVYEIDGIAYGTDSSVKKAAKKYLDDSGTAGYSDILSDYRNNSSKVDRLLDAYLNRDDWSYDINKDPAYLAYSKSAQREGEKAYKNILGNMLSKTGGYMNTAAATAASAGLNSYLETIQDKIPEFMKQSYERYKSDRDADMKDITTAKDIYEKRLSDYLELSNAANEFNRQNGIDEFKRRTDEQDFIQKKLYTDLYDEIMALDMESKNIDNTLNAAAIPYANETAKENYLQEQQDTIRKLRENDKMLVETEGLNRENDKTLAETEKINRENDKTLAETQKIYIQNIYQNAIMRGYFLPDEADALGISQDTDPTFAYSRFLMLGKV